MKIKGYQKCRKCKKNLNIPILVGQRSSIIFDLGVLCQNCYLVEIGLERLNQSKNAKTEEIIILKSTKIQTPLPSWLEYLPVQNQWEFFKELNDSFKPTRNYKEWFIVKFIRLFIIC